MMRDGREKREGRRGKERKERGAGEAGRERGWGENGVFLFLPFCGNFFLFFLFFFGLWGRE
jgi:hypothetical protein